MVKVNHLDTGPCELYLKLENMNPGGSIKDRIGLTMMKKPKKPAKLNPVIPWWKAPPEIPALAWRWWRHKKAINSFWSYLIK
jgi:Cysteine synthase